MYYKYYKILQTLHFVFRGNIYLQLNVYLKFKISYYLKSDFIPVKIYTVTVFDYFHNLKKKMYII